MRVSRSQMADRSRGVIAIWVQIGIAFAVVSMVWLWWAFWGVGFFYDKFCSKGTNCEVMGQIGDLFGGVNALFAGFAFACLVASMEATRRANARERGWARDIELLAQIRSTYEWAYKALFGEWPGALSGHAVGMEWKTASRHLLRAEALARELESETHKIIQQEYREYWRRMFYQQLDSRILGTNYYAEDHVPGSEPIVPIEAALVVTTFAQGEEGADPLKEVDVAALLAANNGTESKLVNGVERFVVDVYPAYAERHAFNFPDSRLAKLWTKDQENQRLRNAEDAAAVARGKLSKLEAMRRRT